MDTVELFPSGWVSKQIPWPESAPFRHHIDFFYAAFNGGGKIPLSKLTLTEYLSIYYSMTRNFNTFAEFRDRCYFLHKGETRINLNELYRDGSVSNRHIHFRTKKYSSSFDGAAGYETVYQSGGQWILDKDHSRLFSVAEFEDWILQLAIMQKISVTNLYSVILRPSLNIPDDVQNELFEMHSGANLPAYGGAPQKKTVGKRLAWGWLWRLWPLLSGLLLKIAEIAIKNLKFFR